MLPESLDSSDQGLQSTTRLIHHGSYLPPIEVLKQTISSADEKGKATIIDEGIRPLDGQFRKAASYSTNDDSATHDSATNASEQNPQGTTPRVMTDRELLLSLHQKSIATTNG